MKINHLMILCLTILAVVASQYNYTSTLATYRESTENEDVLVTQFDIYLFYNDKYTNIKRIPKESVYPTVENETKARFIVTVANTGEKIKFKSIEINSYNESFENIAEHVYKKDYSLDTFEQKILDTGETRTSILDKILVFKEVDQFYKFHCILKYIFSTEGDDADPKIATPTRNITIQAVTGSRPPLDIIIWGMILSFGTVIFMTVLGYLGNKRKEILQSK